MSNAHIVCTTDFSPEGERSFYHALALAVAARARLTLLHVGTESREQVPWQRFPSVRDTLVKWRLLERRPPREAVTDLVEVRKAAMRDEEPVQGILDYLDQHRVELLVMIAHRSRGWGPLRKVPTALRVLRRAATDLLLLPDDGRDLLDRDSGRFLLNRILLPICPDQDISGAVATIRGLLLKNAGGGLAVTLLRIGDGQDGAPPPLPSNLGIEWRIVEREGRTVDVILAEAGRIDADLIVMPTTRTGRRPDLFREISPEKVLSRVRRPLLTVSCG
jgi:nucleotide-binding universal stress UspA family protein